MKNYTPLVLGFFFAVILHGCDLVGSPDDQIKIDDEIIRKYLSENGITAIKSSAGVYFEVVADNETGKPGNPGEVVAVSYTLKLLPGEELIETRSDTLQPVQFHYSPDAILPEVMTHIIALMREKEKFRFYIPSYRAFGEYGHPGIFRENANFILDMELVSLKTENEVFTDELDTIQSYIQGTGMDFDDYPGGLFMNEVREGTGSQPGTHSMVRFHFTRKYLDGTIIATSTDANPIEVGLGLGILARGLEQGLRLMKEGGEAIMILPSELAFGKSLQVIPQKLRADWVKNGNILDIVLPYSPIIYEIELFEII